MAKENTALKKIGDRSTSDVIVRLRTSDGRDDWFYCHSEILVKQSKYFAERLSDDWPICQFLDSRNCIEVYCYESDYDNHVNILRLFLSGQQSGYRFVAECKNGSRLSESSHQTWQ